MHATTMKTKRHYTSPVTQRATVELEGGFCGSVYENNAIQVQGHETGAEYTFDVDGVGGTINNNTSNDFSVTWD